MSSTPTAGAGQALEAGVASLEFARNATLRLVEDIPDDKLCYQPVPDGNSAAWILAHLAWTDSTFLTGVGGQSATVPDAWNRLCGMKSTISPDARDYPDRQVILETMARSRQALIDWLRSLSEARLEAALPDPFAGFAPDHATLASTLAWHEGFHAGQLTPVRRGLGLARVFG